MSDQKENWWCRNLWHSYSARYDTIPPNTNEGLFARIRKMGDSEDMTQWIKAATKRVYVKDICTRCGKEKTR